MSDRLHLLHPRKDVAEMVIVVCVCHPYRSWEFHDSYIIKTYAKYRCEVKNPKTIDAIDAMIFVDLISTGYFKKIQSPAV